MKQTTKQAIIFLTAILVNVNSVKNGFTTWDDEEYILFNDYIKEINLDNLKFIFSSEYASNYNPLHLLTYMLEYQLFGEQPMGYHIVSILMHAANSLLVFSLLLLLSKLPQTAFFGALIFAVHPFHSEVVSWASAQKDLLFFLFFIPALIYYQKFRDNRKPSYFGLTTLFFVFSALSKPAALCLPALLVLLNYYYARKFDRQEWFRLSFFFVLAFSIGLLTLYAQREARPEEAFFEMGDRIALACHSLIQNTFSFFVPINLSAYYSYPEKVNGHIPAHYWLYAIVVASIIIFSIVRFKKKSVLCFSILWILISSALTLQILPAGSAVRADRYMYLPSIGYIFILVSYIPLFFKKQQNIFYALYTIILAVGTIQLNTRWKDSLTLYNSILKKDPNAWLILNNRGAVYMKQGMVENAVQDFEKAIEINPSYYLPYSNLALYHKENGDLETAISFYDMSLDKKKHEKTYMNRGVVFAMQNKFEEAIADFDEAILIKPEYTLALRNRGLAKIFAKMGYSGCHDLQRALELGDVKSKGLISKHCEEIEL